MTEKKELWQYFFNKPKNFYNKYMYELEKYKDHIIYDEENIIAKNNSWNAFFKNENDIYLEIGCGSGNFTVDNAIKFKDRNYIGVELRLKRLAFAGRKSEKNNLKNIVFIRIRGEKLLEFIGENEIAGMYINFPDPWDKKLDKRLFSDVFLNDIRKILKKDGKIFFKTDHLDYYNHVIEVVERNENFTVVYNTDDLYSTEKVKENIKTEFEKLFLSKYNMNIKYIEIDKIK